MANELKSAIERIETLVDAITGFSSAPATVPTDYTAFPFFLVEPDIGTVIKESSGQLRALHTISIQLHLGLPSTLTPSDASEARKYIDLFISTIALDINATLNNTVDTVGDNDTLFEYNYGLIGYRGIPTLGYEITLPVKIRMIESAGAYVKG